MDPRKELADLIRTARLGSGLKQEVFAREIGIVAAHLSRLEKGQGLPSVKLVHRMSSRFGVDSKKVMKLLRRIKGFEVDGEEDVAQVPNVDDAPCLPDARVRRERRVPLVEGQMLKQWLRAFDKSKMHPEVEGSEPVTSQMTKDKLAFWFIVDSTPLAGGNIQVGDMLLVEPSNPPIHEKPVLVLVDGELSLSRYVDLGPNFAVEPYGKIDGRGAQRVFSKASFDRAGNRIYRIAGVNPCYRAFTVRDEHTGTSD